MEKTVNNRNKLSQKLKEFLKIVYSVFIMYFLHDFTFLRTLHLYFSETKMNIKVKMWMKKLFYVLIIVPLVNYLVSKILGKIQGTEMLVDLENLGTR